MSQKTRVLVANHRRVVGECLVDLVANETDMEVVGELFEPDYEDLEAALDQTEPHYLLLGFEANGTCPFYCEALLRRRPELTILVVGDDEKSCTLRSANLETRSAPLENSTTGILRALHGGASGRRHLV